MSNCSVYVGNLPEMEIECFDELGQLMAEVGDIVTYQQVADRGLLRYDYTDEDTARVAIRRLNGRFFRGQKLSVNAPDEKKKEKRPREEPQPDDDDDEPRPKKHRPQLQAAFAYLQNAKLTWESLAELTPAVRAALFSLIEALLEKEPRRVK